MAVVCRAALAAAVIALALGPAAGAAAAAQAGGKVTLPAGTRLLVRTSEGVDSEQHQAGHRFRTELEANVRLDGETVLAKGTVIFGRLTEAKRAGRLAGKAELRLELTDVEIDGDLFPIVTSDYGVKGESQTADTTKKTAGGAVVGAIIGGIAGGGDGAAAGAAIGGGAGLGASALSEGKQVRVPAEALIEFRLAQPAPLPSPR